MKHSLHLFYMSAFLKSQLFLLPVLFLFYQANGLTLEDYYLFQGLIILVNVLLQIPAGYIGDRLSRKWIVVVSYVLFLGRIILWYFWRGYWIVFAGEMFSAVSKGLFDAVESPYIYDVLTQKNKSHKMVKAYSKLNFALSAGTAFASLIGARIYNDWGIEILLGTEFFLMSCAILFALLLPKTEISDKRQTGKVYFSLSQMFTNCFHILRTSPLRFFIFYSGILVACSHFFFWSFTPLMKLALVPVSVFGVMFFLNNVLRSGCSLLTPKLIKWISIKRLSIVCYVLNIIGFASALFLLCFDANTQTHFKILGTEYTWISLFCLGLVFYLSCAITFQLMFTIAHISTLQKEADTHLRTQTASANMMIARLCASLLLIVPKFALKYTTLSTLFSVYMFLFVLLGAFFIRHIFLSQKVR